MTTPATASTATRGPVRPRAVRSEPAEVVAARRAGRHTQLTLVAPGIAERARPGQFVLAAAGDVTPADLRRKPLWLLAAEPSDEYGGTVEVVVDPVSQSSRWLASRAPGHRIELLGPLGRPAPLPAEPTSCLVVGFGTAQASVPWLAATLRTRGCHVSVLLASEPDHELVVPLASRRASDRFAAVACPLPSDSGRTDLILDAVHSLSRSADLVYVAGRASEGALAAAVGERAGAATVVILEHPMPCGTGLCQGCRVPAADAGEASLRVCLDGPALRVGSVDWDLLADPRAAATRLGRVL